jgi:hypothetical protein
MNRPWFGIWMCGVIVVAVFPAGEAYADDVIHACVRPNGALRVVGDPGDCGANETAIAWNVEGPPGADGGERIYGDGSAGDRLFDGGTHFFADANTQYTDFTVEAGTTLHVHSGHVIRCTGVFTNRGTIEVLWPGNAGHQGFSVDGLGTVRPSGQGVGRTVASRGEFGPDTADRSGGSGGAGVTLQMARNLLWPSHHGGGGGAGRMNVQNVVAGSGGGSLTVLCAEGVVNEGEGVIRAAPGIPGNGGGGGGGGQIVLASRGEVINTGRILAQGGRGGRSDDRGGPGGGGGGGIVHLLAPTVHSPGGIEVQGGAAGEPGEPGSITAARRQGGGGGGGAGGRGGIGGAAHANGDPGPAGDGLPGHVIITEVDPTGLF